MRKITNIDEPTWFKDLDPHLQFKYFSDWFYKNASKAGIDTAVRSSGDLDKFRKLPINRQKEAVASVKIFCESLLWMMDSKHTVSDLDNFDSNRSTIFNNEAHNLQT
jgi:hypothetical protein